MGWDVSLIYKGKLCTVVKGEQVGGLIAFSASDSNEQIVSDCDALITYNYTSVFVLALGNNLYDFLDGKQARHTIEMLEKGVEKLGTKKYTDYWAPTMGNAGYVCSVLLKWAKQNLDAVWEISR